MADPVTVAINAALFAAQMALTATQEFEGPRLDNLNIATADYGSSLNYVYGTRRISGLTCIYAEPLREVKRQNKTKGGKYNEYSYYGTWAVVVCGQPSDDITRIWFDKQLIYDKTGSGPITPLGNAVRPRGGVVLHTAILAMNRKALRDYVRIYTGGEDQEPDPRMSAMLDAEFGEGSTPAYRGVTYVMFEDVPLEKFGNRFPIVEVEVITAGSNTFPSDTLSVPITQPNRLDGVAFSPDRSRLVWGAGQEFCVVDLGTRQVMFSGMFDQTEGEVDTVPITGVSNKGHIWGIAGGDTLVKFPSEGLGTAVPIAALTGGGAGVTVVQGGLVEFACVEGSPWHIQYHIVEHVVGNLQVFDTTQIWGFAVRPGCYLTDIYGCLWMFGTRLNVADDGLYIMKLEGQDGAPVSASNERVTLPVSYGAGSVTVEAYHYLDEDAGIDHFVVQVNNATLYTVDRATLTITGSRAYLMDAYNTGKQFRGVVLGSSSIWLDSTEISSADLSTIRTVDLVGDYGLAPQGKIYDSANHAIICVPQFAEEISWAFLDRKTGDGVLLADVVSDVSERCGLIATDYDVTDLDQTITGYSTVQGTGKAWLAPLLEVYNSFARPHDFGVQFLQRGNASLGTIATEVMGAGGTTRYEIPATLDTDLPRRINFTFADVAMDQQPNSVPAQRPVVSVDTVREQSLDGTTLVLDTGSARQYAERYLRRLWFGSEAYDLSLTRAWTKLEPGDVYTLDLDGMERTAELQSLEFRADGVLTTNWRRDSTLIHSLSGAAGAPADGYDGSTVPVLGYTKGFVLDIPLITDSDEGLITYVMAGPYGDVAWPGAIVWEGTDGELFPTLFEGVPADLAATWGQTEDVLPDALATVWDRSSSITVTMRHGELTSATVAEVEAGANLAAIGNAEDGWEIVGFTTATLTAEDTYEVSGFLRGRRGTEFATDSHAVGDYFILLDSDRIRHVMGASDVGDLFYYRPVTAGALETSGFVQELTYSGASLKPYAPAQLEVVAEADGDKIATWVRRTRVGGAWKDFVDVPLGETTEAYAGAILDAGGNVIRTITGLTSPTYNYTAALQSADGYLGASIRMGQVSSTVGVGFLSSATL